MRSDIGALNLQLPQHGTASSEVLVRLTLFTFASGDACFSGPALFAGVVRRHRNARRALPRLRRGNRSLSGALTIRNTLVTQLPLVLAEPVVVNHDHCPSFEKIRRPGSTAGCLEQQEPGRRVWRRGRKNRIDLDSRYGSFRQDSLCLLPRRCALIAPACLFIERAGKDAAHEAGARPLISGGSVIYSFNEIERKANSDGAIHGP
jgi:hypothetical protein